MEAVSAALEPSVEVQEGLVLMLWLEQPVLTDGSVLIGDELRLRCRNRTQNEIGSALSGKTKQAVRSVSAEE